LEDCGFSKDLQILTLMNATGLDVTGAKQKGIIMEGIKVKNLVR
jgi:hypothetical protein